MITETITCKAITPIISKSLDFTQSAGYKVYDFELRPQSVKGVLHFWFRAVAPRVIDVKSLNFENVKDKERRKELQKLYGNLEYKGLRYFESLVFGSQERKAPFGLSVEYDSKDVIEVGKIEEGKFRVNNPEFNRDLMYGLYGTYYTSKDKTENFVEKCLKSGSTFKLNFWFKNEHIRKVIFCLLKLVSVLGGFGAKTTKGFGQFEIIKGIEGFDRSKFVTKREILKLLEELEGVLKEYIEKFDEEKLLVLGKSSGVEFPNLLDESFEFSEIKDLDSNKDWQEVMRKLYGQGGRYRQLKRELRLHKGGDVVKELIGCLEGREKKEVKEVNVFPAVLGMPLQYQNLRCSVKRVAFFPYVPGEEGDKGRKPSPLRIIINKSGNGWTAYALLLKSKVTEGDLLKHDAKVNFQAKLGITLDEVWNLVTGSNKGRGVSNR